MVGVVGPTYGRLLTIGTFYSDGVVAVDGTGKFGACPSFGVVAVDGSGKVGACPSFGVVAVDGVGTYKGFTGWPRKACPTLAPVPSPYAVA